MVYARDWGWSFVETGEGVGGWLAPADAGMFHSFESLIGDGLTYLTDEWNGFVSALPGSADRERVPGDPARTLVGFLVPQVETATLHPVFERPDRSARIIRRVTTKDPDAALRTSQSIRTSYGSGSAAGLVSSRGGGPEPRTDGGRMARGSAGMALSGGDRRSRAADVGGSGVGPAGLERADCWNTSGGRRAMDRG